MDKSEYLVNRYIKTKNKYRKITTYKIGENDLRTQHVEINKFLNDNFIISIFAKGYVKKRSIVTNARAHLYNDIFIMLDIKDFFLNINHNDLIEQLYKEINRKKSISRLECAEIVDKCTTTNNKGLPLGLVTSPILSNIYMKEFDNIIYGRIRKLGLENIIYTRYADDITISYKKVEADNIELISNDIINLVMYQLRKKKLKINSKKTRIYDIHKSNHVRITGINITCNADNFRKLSVGRKEKKELYTKTVNYINNDVKNEIEALNIKGLESFVLSVEGLEYENCYSDKMLNLVKSFGYESLHDAISKLEF